MKRKAKYTHWFWSEYDRSKLEPGLLEAVGHLTFLWNDIEEALDRGFMWAIECPANLQIEIRSRINGLDGKVEIIKAAIKGKGLSDEETGRLLETFSAFEPLKTRRDAVIHARASEIFNGIARTNEKRGAVYEVLLTTESVSAVTAHLEIYGVEMAAAAGRLCDFTPSAAAFRAAAAKDDSHRQLFERATQSYLKVHRDSQTKRKALPKLPELQEAPEVNEWELMKGRLLERLASEGRGGTRKG